MLVQSYNPSVYIVDSLLAGSGSPLVLRTFPQRGAFTKGSLMIQKA